MSELILQIWEESTLGDVIQDGCSLHLNEESRKRYINDYYSTIGNDIPNIYERAVGDPTEVIVSEALYDITKESGSVRLMQNELNNLFSIGDIILKKD
jgi:hypothetical protein